MSYALILGIVIIVLCLIFQKKIKSKALLLIAIGIGFGLIGARGTIQTIGLFFSLESTIFLTGLFLFLSGLSLGIYKLVDGQTETVFPKNEKIHILGFIKKKQINGKIYYNFIAFVSNDFVNQKKYLIPQDEFQFTGRNKEAGRPTPIEDISIIT